MACDINPDGLKTTAFLKYLHNDGTFRIHQLVDPNGAQAGCGDLNLELGEGVYVDVWACVETIGCTPRVFGRA